MVCSVDIVYAVGTVGAVGAMFVVWNVHLTVE